MRKVLVLDDNADILEVVTEVLRYEQFEVRAISSAPELLPLAEFFRPDLVLLDLRLADGHGGDLCRQIKSHPTLNQPPVVIFTAYPFGGSLGVYGCDAVIHKPFDLEYLVNTVTELTNGHVE